MTSHMAEGERGRQQYVQSMTAHLKHPLRFSIHVEDGQTNDVVDNALHGDLVMLNTFITMGIQIEKDREELTDKLKHYGSLSRGPMDHETIVDNALSNYFLEQYPRTDFITQELLLRLSAAACLVYVMGEQDCWNNTVIFAQALAYADNLLLQAQRDGARSSASLEYRRVLDHKDDFESMRQPSHQPGNNLRTKWIVALRIRTRGRGANPFGPGQGSE